MEGPAHKLQRRLQQNQPMNLQITIPQQVSPEGNMEQALNLSHQSSIVSEMPPLVTLCSITVSSSSTPVTCKPRSSTTETTSLLLPSISEPVQTEIAPAQRNTPEPTVSGPIKPDTTPVQSIRAVEEMNTSEVPVKSINGNTTNALATAINANKGRNNTPSSAPSSLNSEGSAIAQNIRPLNQGTGPPARPPVPHNFTFPAGYMVIPTAHWQNMRMSAQDGQKFLQVIPGPGVQKLSDAQVAQLAPNPVQGTRLATPIPSQSVGPRPTLLYSPNQGVQPQSVIKTPRVKEEDGKEMLLVSGRQKEGKDLIDDEQKAGQALVQLANSGKPHHQTPLQTPEVTPDSPQLETGKGEEIVRQNIGQALVDLSRGEPHALPLLIGNHRPVQQQLLPVFLPTPKVLETSINSNSSIAGSSKTEKDPLRKILKKPSAGKSVSMGAGSNLEMPVSSPPADVAAELTTFINNYYNPDSSRKNQKQIPMKELRHVIPLLVLHCFDMKDHALHKKVKGLWVNSPADWPESVPFCDPNNSKQKGELVGKPKKDTLIRMFHFLIKKYWEKSGSSGGVVDDYVEPVQESIVASEHGYTRNHTPSPNSPVKTETPPAPLPSDQALNSQSPGSQTPSNQMHTNQVANNQLPSSQIQRPDTVGAMNLTMPKAVVEEDNNVMETEDEDLQCEDYDRDYDPIKEIMSRLISKITMLKEKKLIPDQHLGLLLIIHDLLNKMRSMIQDNLAKRFFIEKANEFEASVDIAKIEKAIPKAHREKWHDFEDKWYVKVVRQTSLVLGT